MTKQPKLTPWFPRRVKPVRPGVYETDFTGMAFSYFDGSHWNGGWRTAFSAAESQGFYRISGHEGCARAMTRWRGLASKA